MNRVQWLNSLPGKYKNEILNKLLEEGVELDINKHYKVVVDLHSNQSFHQLVDASSPSRTQIQRESSPHVSIHDGGRSRAATSPAGQEGGFVEAAGPQAANTEEALRVSWKRIREQDYEDYLNNTVAGKSHVKSPGNGPAN